MPETTYLTVEDVRARLSTKAAGRRVSAPREGGFTALFALTPNHADNPPLLRRTYITLGHFVESRDVREAHEEIMRLTGYQPASLIDIGELEGALGRARNAAAYAGADLPTQAALLIHGIATAHAFVDGNKRTAAASGEVFLDFNGWYIASPSSDDTTLGQ